MTSGPGCLGSKSSSYRVTQHVGWPFQALEGGFPPLLAEWNTGEATARSHQVAACFTLFVRCCFEGQLTPHARFLVSPAQLLGLLVVTKNTPDHSERVTLCDDTQTGQVGRYLVFAESVTAGCLKLAFSVSPSDWCLFSGPSRVPVGQGAGPWAL